MEKEQETKSILNMIDQMLMGAEFCISPELPQIEFKRNGIKYTCTNLRLLYPAGIAAVLDIIKIMMDNSECEDISFDASRTDEATLSIIKDIVMGVRFSATKKGRNGFYSGGILVEGVKKDGDIITFFIPKKNVTSIYKYAQKNPSFKDSCTFEDVIVALCRMECSEYCVGFFNRKNKNGKRGE